MARVLFQISSVFFVSASFASLVDVYSRALLQVLLHIDIRCAILSFLGGIEVHVGNKKAYLSILAYL